MNFAVFIPIIAMCCAAAIILTWMSNRHERAKWKLLGEEGGGRRELEAENAQLRATIERLERSGVARYLTKPIGIPELLEAVERALSADGRRP